MIKKTFYNLPQEKRERIINAIIAEFSAHPTEKVSINKIIERADISRGSFYQYFDDKVDLIEVVVKRFFESLYENAKAVLIKSNGDIFLMYIRFFDLISNVSDKSEERAVIRNLFSSLKANDDLVSEYLRNRLKTPVDKDNIYDYVDRSQLHFTSDFDVKCLIEILTQLFKNAIFDLFVVEAECDSVRERYIRKIEIIKAGALK